MIIKILKIKNEIKNEDKRKKRKKRKKERRERLEYCNAKNQMEDSLHISTSQRSECGLKYFKTSLGERRLINRTLIGKIYYYKLQYDNKFNVSD